MDILTLIAELMETHGTIIVLTVSILLYLLVHGPIEASISLVSNWRNRTVRSKRDKRIIRRVRSVLSSLGGAPIEVVSNEIKTIIAMGELALEPLVEALKHRNPRIRWIAAKALGEINVPEALAPLIRISGDKDSSVRLTITSILGNSNDRRVIEPLVIRLRDSDYFVRLAALQPFASGKIKNALAVAPLIQFLKDKEPNTRKDAAKALGEIGDPRAVAPLIKALNDYDWGVQEQVIWALKQIGHPQALEPLIKMLAQGIPYIRLQAARALLALGDRRALEPLQKAAQAAENEEIKGALLEARNALMRKNPRG